MNNLTKHQQRLYDCITESKANADRFFQFFFDNHCRFPKDCKRYLHATQPCMPLLDLAKEILESIFIYLPMIEFIRLAPVCKRFADCVRNPVLKGLTIVYYTLPQHKFVENVFKHHPLLLSKATTLIHEGFLSERDRSSLFRNVSRFVFHDFKYKSSRLFLVVNRISDSNTIQAMTGSEITPDTSAMEILVSTRRFGVAKQHNHEINSLRIDYPNVETVDISCEYRTDDFVPNKNWMPQHLRRLVLPDFYMFPINVFVPKTLRILVIECNRVLRVPDSESMFALALKQMDSLEQLTLRNTRHYRKVIGKLTLPARICRFETDDVHQVTNYSQLQYLTSLILSMCSSDFQGLVDLGITQISRLRIESQEAGLLHTCSASFASMRDFVDRMPRLFTLEVYALHDSANVEDTDLYKYCAPRFDLTI